MIFITWHGSLDLMFIILILMPWNAPNYRFTHWATVLTLTTPHHQHLLSWMPVQKSLAWTMEPIRISKILWWLEFPPVAIRFAGYNCMGQFTTLIICSGIHEWYIVHQPSSIRHDVSLCTVWFEKVLSRI